MNKKGFTLIELLAVIVILAILMVSAGAAIMSTLNNAKVNTFKNEALEAIDMATNMYTEVSMNVSDSALYLKNDTNANYKGMCVTLQGLVENGYLDKDLANGAVYGVILVEVPFDGGATKYTIWMSDGTYGINGVEKNKINGMRFKKDNNSADAYDAVQKGVVTKLTGINKIAGLAYTGEELGADTTAIYNTDSAPSGTPSAEDMKNYISQPVDIKSNTSNGGYGVSYSGLRCINHKIA